MRKRLAVACVALALLPVPGGAEVEIRRRGDRLDLLATSTPLADLLQRLARETGMKVVYEGAPPRNLLTVTLLDRTPAEAVLGLFEGLGLNYAVIFDRTGTRIDTLLLAGAAGSGTTPTRVPPPAARIQAPVRPPFSSRGAREERDELDEPAEEPEAGEAPAEAEPSPEPSPLPPLPVPGQPGSPFDLRPRPLTFPTPVPPGTASPAPSPSPSPNPQA
jgi:hypothetical protein